MKAAAALALTLLLLACRTGAHAADDCAFQPPAALLQPHAYTGQSQVRESGNRLREEARLGQDVHIEIRHGGCADFVTTEYVFTVPDTARSEDALIDLARTEIARLKTRRPLSEQAGVLAFLQHAHTLQTRDAARALCRDGSAADAGACSWDSGGGYVVAVKRTGRATRVSVMEYVSG